MVSNEPTYSLDWAPDAIVVTGLDGSILHVNPRAEDLFGYRKDELAERPLELLIPEGLASATLESAPLQHLSRAVICAHRDGTRFPGTARWRPAPGGRGEVVVFSVRTLDGVDRPNGAGVAAADERVELLSLFAHDVRESLQAVQFVCDSLRARAPAEAATVSEIIASVCKLLERCIRDARMEPLVEPCPLGELLATLGRELLPLAKRKGLSFSVDGIDDVILTDPVLFREVLHNLLANAIRYTDSGRVEVRCHPDLEHVRVEIVDTGAGIASERLNVMLNRAAGPVAAETSDASSHAHETGERSGRGLAIVHHLARVLDCTLEVDSAPGLGSRFVVIAPRAFGRELRLGNGDA